MRYDKRQTANTVKTSCTSHLDLSPESQSGGDCKGEQVAF